MPTHAARPIPCHASAHQLNACRGASKRCRRSSFTVFYMGSEPPCLKSVENQVFWAVFPKVPKTQRVTSHL
eukprot:9456919-Lingulodinium_polyedra.AAC.1